MGCRRIGSECSGVLISQLRDGELGEIVKWGRNRSVDLIGQIVQRFNNEIIIIGEKYGRRFDAILTKEDLTDYRVILLKEGDCITIEKYVLGDSGRER